MVLQELTEEISGYAKKYITLEIEDFSPNGADNSKWDEEDQGSFRVIHHCHLMEGHVSY